MEATWSVCVPHFNCLVCLYVVTFAEWQMAICKIVYRLNVSQNGVFDEI